MEVKTAQDQVEQPTKRVGTLEALMAATTPKRQKPEAKEAVGARLLEMREGNTLLQNPMQRRMQAAPRSSSAAELRADIAALKAELLAKVKGTAAIADTGSIARPGNLLEAPAPIAKAGGIAKAGKLLEAAVPTAKAGGIAEACKLLDAAAPIAEAACVAVAPAGSVQVGQAHHFQVATLIFTASVYQDHD